MNVPEAEPDSITTQRVFIAALVDVATNPRPRRAYDLCRALGIDVVIVGEEPSQPLDIVQQFKLTQPLSGLPRVWWRVKVVAGICLSMLIRNDRILDRIADFRWRLDGLPKSLGLGTQDSILVESIQMLPWAMRARGNGSVIVDLREFYPDEFPDRLWFRFVEKRERQRLCAVHLKDVDEMLTVSPGLQDLYQRLVGRRPHLLRSMPDFVDLAPSRVDPKCVKLVHVGGAIRSRHLELLLKTMRLLDRRFELHMYLVGDESYQLELRSLAPPRVFFHEALSADKIIEEINHYDIGVFLLRPIGANHEFVLPNKVFQYIQARLMVAVSPNPDMAQVVLTHNCGLVSADYSPKAFAEMLDRLSAGEIEAFKRASHAASKHLCSEFEMTILKNILLGRLPG